MTMPRRETRPVMRRRRRRRRGGAAIAVQSMTNTDTRDAAATLAQIARLAEAGCEIVRVAIPHADALEGFAAGVRRLAAARRRRHPLRPPAGHRSRARAAPPSFASTRATSAPLERFDAVIDAAGEARHPGPHRRERGLARRRVRREGLAARRQARRERRLVLPSTSPSRGFDDIVVSAKASSVPATVDAYRSSPSASPYPLHLGVTEAGTLLRGAVKSSVGLGILLEEGIGDTLRVSLTADPVEEVARRLGHPRRARHPPPRPRARQLPDVRPLRGRPHTDRRGGRAAAARACARRSRSPSWAAWSTGRARPRRRYRRRRGPRRRADLREGRDRPQGPRGRDRRRAVRGDRAAELTSSAVHRRFGPAHRVEAGRERRRSRIHARWGEPIPATARCSARRGRGGGACMPAAY